MISNNHKKPTRPPTQVVGNLSNQKYEAVCNIRHHFESILNATPSKETSRWKYENNYHLMKHQGKRRMQDKSLEDDNLILSNRILEIVTEDRERRTHEFCPGLRVGRGGTVIDCYESSCQPFLEYKQYIRKKMRRNKDEKIDLGNVYIKKFIDASKSTVANKDLRKSYENNRVLYNFLSSGTPHTALHLGILQKAKFELRKSNHSSGYIHRLGSPSKSPTHSVSVEEISNPKRPNNIPKSSHAAADTHSAAAVVVIESRLEMDMDRPLLSRQHSLKPLFTECARYGSITSLQLPRSQPPQPTQIVLPRPRTAPAMRASQTAHQPERKSDEEVADGEAVAGEEEEEDREWGTQMGQQHTLRGIRHLQALRKSVSFEGAHHLNPGGSSVPPQQQQAMQQAQREEQVPGSQWSALLEDSDDLQLAASFQRLGFGPNNPAADSRVEGTPLQQELGDELSLLYESLLSRRHQLLSAAQQEEEQRDQAQRQKQQPVPCEVLGLPADSCCPSEAGSGSPQEDPQLCSDRSHHSVASLLSNTNNICNDNVDSTPLEDEAAEDPGAGEPLVEVSLLEEEEEEPPDCSVLALTYSHLDPSTHRLLHLPHFPCRDTHPTHAADDSGAGELTGNSCLSLPRVPASSVWSVGSSRLGRAWQQQNMQRSASVWSALSAPVVAAAEARMKMKVTHRQSMICQCAVQPPLLVQSPPSEGGGIASSPGSSGWRPSHVHSLCGGRVTSFLLNLLDVGVCLPGNSKPFPQEVAGCETCTEQDASSELARVSIDNFHPHHFHSNLNNSSSVDNNVSSVASSLASHHRFSLATSVGLLVELVPVLSQDQDQEGGEEDGEMDRIGRQLYCQALLSLQRLQGLAGRPGFADLHFALSELLQFPVDAELPSASTPSSRAAASGSSLHSGGGGRGSRAVFFAHSSSHPPSTAAAGPNHHSLPLYSSLSSVLDADSELQLFRLLAGAVQLRVDGSGQASLGFSDS